MVKKETVEAVDVHLESIQIDGYRSCRSTIFSPNSKLSALIGINGAGKTNILQAIRLLDVNRTRSIRKHNDANLEGMTKITAWFKVSGKRIGLRLTLTSIEGSRRADELVAVDEVWNLAPLTGSKAWRRMPPANFLREAHSQKGLMDKFFYSTKNMVI